MFVERRIKRVWHVGEIICGGPEQEIVAFEGSVSELCAALLEWTKFTHFVLKHLFKNKRIVHSLEWFTALM